MDKNGLKIRYSDLWGTHKKKFDFLEKHDLKNTKWREIAPKEPNYFFVPRDIKSEKIYSSFIGLNEIFSNSQIGLMTGQDNFFLDKNLENLKVKIRAIFNPKINNQELKTLYNLRSQAGNKLIQNRNSVKYNDELFTLYSYKPFDIYNIYIENKFLWRSVEKLRLNFVKPNIALVTTRILAGLPFRHAFITENIGDNTFISSFTKERNYFFPLYLYSENNQLEQQTIFSGQEKLNIVGSQHTLRNKKGKEPNVKSEIFEILEKSFKKKPLPEEIFHYIYAILYSNEYRKKYNEFLKTDFPRIPFTSDYSLFKKLSKLGEELANLHLLRSKSLNKMSAKYKGAGLNEVKKREYREKEKRLYINDNQYFEGIEREIWSYHIGGYQVLGKWMKDRIGKSLGREDIEHYLKVVEVLGKTIGIQKEIDKYYPKVERKIK